MSLWAWGYLDSVQGKVFSLSNVTPWCSLSLSGSSVFSYLFPFPLSYRLKLTHHSFSLSAFIYVQETTPKQCLLLLVSCSCYQHILLAGLSSTGYLLSWQGEHNRIASSQPVSLSYLVNILSPLPHVFPLHSATSSLACLSPFTLHFTHVICQSSLIHAPPVTKPL